MSHPINDGFEPVCNRMEWLDPFYKSVWQKAYDEGIPISGTFELTPQCNFNCGFCYVHQNSKELSADEWIRIAQEAKAAGTTWLVVTGGEPLVHPEFKTIWKALCNMGFFITLQTNATLITDEILQLFNDYPPKLVKITLYGTNDDVYEKVCGIQQGFTKVNDGIHRLMSMNIPITMVSTITKDNEDDTRNMAWYAYCHHIPWTATGGLRSSNRGGINDVAHLRDMEKVKEAERQHMKKLLDKPLDPNRRPCTYCKDYRLGYWITWNGNMQFCSFMNIPHISILHHTFLEAWQKLLDFEDNLQWPKECTTCEANKLCFKCAATIADKLEGSTKQSEHCKLIKELYKEL